MPLKRGEDVGAPFAPGGEDHLGVALGAEAVARGLELRAHLAEIVDLAIE